MKQRRISKHDTRKVQRKKHDTLIEHVGLYSRPWLNDSTLKRQTRILITRGTDRCHLSKQPTTMCFHWIIRQKAQMMHLASHYL